MSSRPRTHRLENDGDFRDKTRFVGVEVDVSVRRTETSSDFEFVENETERQM